MKGFKEMSDGVSDFGIDEVTPITYKPMACRADLTCIGEPCSENHVFAARLTEVISGRIWEAGVAALGDHGFD